VLRLSITSLNHDGEGVGRLDEGMVVFVPGAVPGDTVTVRIVESSKNYMRGQIAAIEKPSPDRMKPPCAVADPCGGCSLQQVNYEAQLYWKTQAVKDALSRIGGLNGVPVYNCIGAQDPFHYRNKVQFPVGMDRGRPIAGCYARGTHKVISTEDCLIQHETNNLIVKETLKLIEELKLTVYDEARGGGMIRHIMARVAPGTGESMAVIVTSRERFTCGGELSSALMKRVPGLMGVIQNINEEKTNIILGSKSRVILGRGFIDDLFGNDRLGRLKFRISPLSFYQVNSVQAAELYATAIEFGQLKKNDVAIDLYSGIGTITLFLAEKCKTVLGIEEVPEAVRDAEQNARLNQITNVQFRAARAERLLPSIAGGLREKPTVVYLDPPRKGCEPEVLQTIISLKPQRVVYVSCYPSTLARDLAILARGGFVVKKAQPVDMFPQTSHVETVALLTRAEDSQGARD
jgi:23S rRNA (uracil1939-C5)-methyltransferase